MNIDLIRTDKKPSRIIGRLYVNDSFLCYTLEGDKPIPSGIYEITITQSARFGRTLPLVNGVKDRSGIRIHPGNTAEDTSGCVLVGLNRGEDDVLESRLAMDALQPKIQRAIDTGERVVLYVSYRCDTEIVHGG